MSRLSRPLAAAVSTAALVLLCASGASAKTTWLCQPGLKSNPCRTDPSVTTISPTGAVLGTASPSLAGKPKVDCFYVYPTVSDQKTIQANKKIDPEERSIALYQAAAYSSTCRVFAPMYRQITLQGLLQPGKVTAKMRATAYADVRDAWRDYLKHDNKGRGVVFVSHSQGTFVLRQLLAKEVDAKPSVRKRLVSAILLGGNTTNKDFKHITPCVKATQTGCAIAFSTFGATPPANAVFGKGTNNAEVLCTNPAALGGGAATLTSLFPSAPFAPGTTIGALTTQVGMPQPSVSTPWIQARAYTGECVSANGINVLKITGVAGAPDLKPLPDATWGLHLVDANIALGDLLKVVGRQAARYAAGR
ncbi:MAG TPA: DUF3089 domain-containing protein [Baekduia sp.]|nr:DUF3089 domain-containing protein [Baekduia sp.]